VFSFAGSSALITAKDSIFTPYSQELIIV